MSEKLLVVDDDTNLSRAVAFSLERAGFEVVTAETGALALTMVAVESPDLVILDVMLPDISGIEVCQQLRRAPETSSLPIIMLSAKAQVPEMVEGLEAGADEYVTKPVNLSELTARVKALLARTERLRGSDQRAPGNSLGFVGAKGGVGTTTVALSVAAALARRKHRVVAAEMTSHFGSFSRLLKHVPNENLHHLLQLEPQEVGQREVSARLVDTQYGLRVLFGPQKVGELGDMGPAHAESIVAALNLLADRVVMDLPQSASDSVRVLVCSCRSVALVTEPDRACVKAAHVNAELLSSWGVTGDVIRVVVVNRAPLPISMTLNEIRSELGLQVAGAVPFAPAATTTAQQHGVPLFIHQPESEAGSALEEIAKGLE